MERISRYYFTIEGIIIIGIFLIGLYEHAVWLFGAVFVGIPISLLGIVLGLAWRTIISVNKTDKTVPNLAISANIFLLVFIVLLLIMMFSGGTHFMM